MKRLLLFVFLTISPFVPTVHAQFWHALPSISTTAGFQNAQFSNDEKKVFYLSGDGKIENIWSVVVADKWGGIIAGKHPPVQITKFTGIGTDARGVVRFFHLLDSPDILYMRATKDGKDFHIYRIADDGSGTPQDLTPGGAGVTSEIIGASYDGRYVYYTSNPTSRDEVDVYRYDTQQFTSEDIFPNDKDYRALAWSRDQNKLLLELPETGALSLYNIETTERDPIALPSTAPVMEATFDPVSQNLIVMQKSGDSSVEYTRPLSTGTWKLTQDYGALWMDFSPSGTYEILHTQSAWQVRARSTGAILPLPEGARPLAIAPHETMMLYSLPAVSGSQLYLYDIPKKTTTKLAAVQ